MHVSLKTESWSVCTLVELNPRERFEKALKLEPVDRVPAASPLQTGTVDLMKACGAFWPDAHRDAEKMAKLALAAYEVAGLESVRIPFDMAIEAEAMGTVLNNWLQDRQPTIAKHAIETKEDVDKLKIPDPQKDGRMPTVVKATKILSEKVGKKLPVIVAISAPFETVARLEKFEKLMRDTITAPNDLIALLRRISQIEIEYGKALIDAGATAITLVDGSSSNLGPEFYSKFSLPFENEVVKNLQTYTILHICGNTKIILDKMVQSGVNGISIDSEVSISDAKSILGKRVALVGNVSTFKLWRGTVEEVEKEATKCLEQGTDVLAPACGFPPHTPLQNMKTLANVVRKYKNID
jgi:[methyl-Co(III) methanol-specific corrinoid protein]:coenzyme M methyltransferase